MPVPIRQPIWGGSPPTLYCGPSALCGGAPATPIETPTATGDGSGSSSGSSGSQHVAPGSGASSTAGSGTSGGSGSADPSFPGTVGLVSGNRVVCSGVLLGANTILTAAHCTCGRPLDKVVIGRSMFEKDGFHWERDLNKDALLIDPHFCEQRDQAVSLGLLDLAVVRPVDPLPVPTSFFVRDFSGSGEGMVVVGFGRSHLNDAGGVKRYAPIELRHCSPTESSTHRCAAGVEYISVNPPGINIDTCYGDSGGPVYSLSGGGVLSLKGVTSRRIAGGKEQFCGSGGIYVATDVTRVRQWLGSIVGIGMPYQWPRPAGFSVCNRSNQPLVNVSVGHRDHTSGWTSRGWFRIAANECKTLVGRELTDRYYYVYATAPSGAVWKASGSEPGGGFCVHPNDAYELLTKDYRTGDVLNCEGHRAVNFIPVDTGEHRSFTYDLTDANVSR
jgi:uncharacterized membrane protein